MGRPVPHSRISQQSSQQTVLESSSTCRCLDLILPCLTSSLRPVDCRSNVSSARSSELISLQPGVERRLVVARASPRETRRVDDYEAQIWENGVVVGTVNFSVSNSGNTLTLGGYTLTWDSTSCSYIAQIGGTLHQRRLRRMGRHLAGLRKSPSTQ